MEILDRLFGMIVLVLWAMLVLVKRWATGSLLGDRPNGGVWIWLVHVFNFSFLLVANPLAAVLLMSSRTRGSDSPGLSAALGAAGVLVSAVGCFLMAWALATLRRNFQVCGNPPRNSDQLVTRGPYRLVRHPMYTGAVCVSFGLACLTRSLVYFGVFCLYVLLVLLLVPSEERGLQRAYGGRYAAYRKAVKRLVPLLY
jgi:protein-S-isoprenylcysteine O-methyltransferase Ste14